MKVFSLDAFSQADRQLIQKTIMHHSNIHTQVCRLYTVLLPQFLRKKSSGYQAVSFFLSLPIPYCHQETS